MAYSIKYRDLTPWQRQIVRTLRKYPNAQIVSGRSWGLTTAIKYLTERGYSPKPTIDKELTYFAEKQIEDLNRPNVFMERYIGKWD